MAKRYPANGGRWGYTMAITSETEQDAGAKAGRDGGKLFSLLAGRSCPECDGGELERGAYKGNRAVLCDTCEVPRVQVW